MVRLIVIILIVLIVDIIGGYIIGTKVIIPVFYRTEELVEYNGPSQEEGKGKASRKHGIEKALDSINLNPANSNGEIFSCDIVLEAENQEVINELTIRNYEIMDKLSSYLSFKTVEELNNPNNWEKYKNDMLDIVNNTLTSGGISYIYIPAKIIQFTI